MEDLFEREQSVLNHALLWLQEMENSKSCPMEEYSSLVEEYRKVLKQLRRITKISDKTTINLNASMLDLQDQVRYDELTGIYNRRFLDENFCRILHSLTYTNGTLSVLMIDVDFFKMYNDTYGHGEGDECLRTIAQTLQNSIEGSEDFVARYGGEEFVAVLQDTDENDARCMAERVLKNIRACNIPHKKSNVERCVTVSVGVTTGKVAHFHRIENYISIADKALYLSKRNGRNQSTFIKFEEEM